MENVRKLTMKSIGTRNACTLKHLNSSIPKPYQPRSRIEKIRAAGLVLPKSTPSKVVFISNAYGNGFCDEVGVFGSSVIPIQEMKDELNKTCYRQWEKHKNELERQPMEKPNIAINWIKIAICLTLAIILVSLLLGYEVKDMITWLVVICMAIGAIILVMSFVLYFCSMEELDLERAMICVIKQKLADFNHEEEQESLGRPRFRWTCSHDCIWVAIEVFETGQSMYNVAQE